MDGKEGPIDVFDETDYGKMDDITNLMKSFDITAAGGLDRNELDTESTPRLWDRQMRGREINT